MNDVAIELRKYAGTRGGRVVLVVLAAVALLLAGVGAAVTSAPAVPVARALTYPMTVLELALPLVVVLMVCAEWSSRDAVQTFLMRPRRAAVLAAKSLAAGLVVLVGLVWGLAATVTACAVRSAVSGSRIDVDGLAAGLGRSVLTTVVYAAFAMGISLLVARTAIALVIYLVAVSLLDTALAVVLGEKSVWLSLAQSVTRLGGDEVHAADLPMLASSFGLWIVLPLVAGSLLFLRREAR